MEIDCLAAPDAGTHWSPSCALWWRGCPNTACSEEAKGAVVAGGGRATLRKRQNLSVSKLFWKLVSSVRWYCNRRNGSNRAL